jgi:hypothetical protein
MSACGAVPISRLAGWSPQMPAAQGYIATGGPMFRPNPIVFAMVTDPPFASGANLDAIGLQWAPGQGGSTPGGGGAAMIGETMAVETAWIQDGLVVPPTKAHVPGTVGWMSSRRSRA